MISRFAVKEEIESYPFQEVLKRLRALHHQYNLPDFHGINMDRYPWSAGMQSGSEIYASRLWEYPFAILEGQPGGKTCVDIGCGMSEFTIYLKEVSEELIGVDPDLFKAGTKGPGFGVSAEYLERTDLNVVTTTERLMTNCYDRVFCISVIEHLPRRGVAHLVREMTRILKPGGQLIMTVDVNIHYDMARPLSLIWESGLVPIGELDLRWPTKRFGKADDNNFSADVYGMVLEKPDEFIAEFYSDLNISGGIRQSEIPSIRHKSEKRVFKPLRLKRWFKAEYMGR